ncbi:MAG TPA: hypothetical protein VFI38_07990 [Candidatus Acidoferrum sp.]|nr:hypothetical protein [Candidatus Acidoferrum sp.]
MNRTQTETKAMETSVAELALRELQDRIEASGLESSYAELVCDLCVGQVSLEKAFGEIHQKAMERMVELLDTRILEDEVALEACLDKIAKESERVAWSALEQGTEALREGLAILEGTESLGDGGYVN